MLLTLPLVPVFMWLIGRYTEQRTQERWQALRQLSTHFLDVVRGLPTLRAFGRAEHQATTLAEVSERYRSATMQTLRVSFLSGSVLELAATLGVALVAVAAGLRLVVRRSRAPGRADRARARARAVSALPPAGGRVPRERRRTGGRRATVRAARCPGRGRPPAARSSPPSPARAPVRFERCRFSYPNRPEPCSTRLDLELGPGETVALVGRERSREEHRSRPCCSALYHAHRRADQPSAASISLPVTLAGVAPDGRLGAPASDAVSRHRRAEHPPGRSGRVRPAGARGRGPGRGGRLHPGAAARPMRRRSAMADARCRPASAGASAWRARFSRTHRSCCSTSRRRTSTRGAWRSWRTR